MADIVAPRVTIELTKQAIISLNCTFSTERYITIDSSGDNAFFASMMSRRLGESICEAAYTTKVGEGRLELASAQFTKPLSIEEHRGTLQLISLNELEIDSIDMYTMSSLLIRFIQPHYVYLNGKLSCNGISGEQCIIRFTTENFEQRPLSILEVNQNLHITGGAQPFYTAMKGSITVAASKTLTIFRQGDIMLTGSLNGQGTLLTQAGEVTISASCDIATIRHVGSENLILNHTGGISTTLEIGNSATPTIVLAREQLSLHKLHDISTGEIQITLTHLDLPTLSLGILQANLTIRGIMNLAITNDIFPSSSINCLLGCRITLSMPVVDMDEFALPSQEDVNITFQGENNIVKFKPMPSLDFLVNGSQVNITYDSEGDIQSFEMRKGTLYGGPQIGFTKLTLSGGTIDNIDISNLGNLIVTGTDSIVRNTNITGPTFMFESTSSTVPTTLHATGQSDFMFDICGFTTGNFEFTSSSSISCNSIMINSGSEVLFEVDSIIIVSLLDIYGKFTLTSKKAVNLAETTIADGEFSTARSTGDIDVTKLILDGGKITVDDNANIYALDLEFRPKELVLAGLGKLYVKTLNEAGNLEINGGGTIAFYEPTTTLGTNNKLGPWDVNIHVGSPRDAVELTLQTDLEIDGGISVAGDSKIQINGDVRITSGIRSRIDGELEIGQDRSVHLDGSYQIRKLIINLPVNNITFKLLNIKDTIIIVKGTEPVTAFENQGIKLFSAELLQGFESGLNVTYMNTNDVSEHQLFIHLPLAGIDNVQDVFMRSEESTVPPYCLQGCECPAPFTNADCINGEWVTGDIIINDGEEIIFGDTTIIIGNFSVTSGGIVTIKQGSVLDISQCSDLSGTLSVELDDLSNEQIELIKLNRSCSTGQFDNVTVSETDVCNTIKSQRLQQEAGTVTLLLSVEKNCEGDSFPIAYIVIIVVIIVIVLLAIIGASVVLLVPRIRHRVLPYRHVAKTRQASRGNISVRV
eukprot:CAMPEP_0168516462 /NCGR_PEP_ID=MMETSP0405-20121227/5416_1 /TAXON_ID=498012 /ORGANISM="Trichosphaerium sp, Strain Am-I-7 wt" /LENGTH=980 /DNA_ID=CAMNT_0008536177 /DNA_START=189 /DNA_END=3131 /DNA_ORIENTATION=-